MVLQGLTASALIIFLSVFTVGCFKAIIEKSEPVPELVWPSPPEIPRIRFVTSISRPQDMNIREGTIKKLMRFFKGTKENSIVNPYGLTTDRQGRLFVVDTVNRQVHVFDEGKGAYFTFPQGEPSLKSPIGIAVDENGNIFVTDSTEAVVRVFNDHGKKYIREIGRGILSRPTGITVNHITHELLVVDTLKSEVIRFDLSDYRVKGAIRRGDLHTGMFHYPTNISVSGNGLIFVTDSLNFRIQVFSPEGAFLNSFGQPGNRPGYFARPKGVAIDTDGNIYVVDSLFDNVQVFNSEGSLLMDFGSPGHDYGKFWLPTGIFIDKKNRIYVSDAYNNRVQIFQYIKGGDY